MTSTEGAIYSWPGEFLLTLVMLGFVGLTLLLVWAGGLRRRGPRLSQNEQHDILVKAHEVSTDRD